MDIVGTRMQKVMFLVEGVTHNEIRYDLFIDPRQEIWDIIIQ
jgi:hypothetical protein